MNPLKRALFGCNFRIKRQNDLNFARNRLKLPKNAQNQAKKRQNLPKMSKNGPNPLKNAQKGAKRRTCYTFYTFYLV